WHGKRLSFPRKGAGKCGFFACFALGWPTSAPKTMIYNCNIKAGTIMPSTILRRLATYSRKSKLYFAFRELGRVVRTTFLLQYVSDLELRQVIQGIRVAIHTADRVQGEALAAAQALGVRSAMRLIGKSAK